MRHTEMSSIQSCSIYCSWSLWSVHRTIVSFRSYLCLGVAPATHACIIHGLPRMGQMGFLYLCIMAVTYILGGITYAVRVPERFFPGRNRSIEFS